MISTGTNLPIRLEVVLTTTGLYAKFRPTQEPGTFPTSSMSISPVQLTQRRLFSSETFLANALVMTLLRLISDKGTEFSCILAAAVLGLAKNFETFTTSGLTSSINCKVLLKASSVSPGKPQITSVAKVISGKLALKAPMSFLKSSTQ